MRSLLFTLCLAFGMSASAQTKAVSPFEDIASWGNHDVRLYKPDSSVTIFYQDEQYQHAVSIEHVQMAESLEGALVVATEILNILEGDDNKYNAVWYDLSNGFHVLHSYNSVTIYGAHESHFDVDKGMAKHWIKCLRPDRQFVW